MQIKEEKITSIMKVAFGVMLLSVVALFLCGEMFGPSENPTDSAECVLYDGEWEYVSPDGIRESVEVPGQCDAERNKVVRLETTLPQYQENTWFCMRASQQNMRVYVGDEIRKEYCTEDTRLFGRNSASAFVFFKVKEEDAGKVLAIELVSDSEYAGFLNEVYVGDKYDIIAVFVKECSLVILISIYMFILGSITVFIGAILRFTYKKKVAITYLGLGIMQLALAMIAESRLRQFFMPNSSIASHIGFLLTILVPYPFVVYISRIQKGRYEKMYKGLAFCVAVNFFVSTLLQLCNVVDFADSMVVSYALIIVMVGMMAVAIGLDIKRGHIKEYGELVYGIIVMLVATVWETYLTFFPLSPYHGGVALSIGLIIMLFMAASKTARDMLETEREKQVAIAAGEAKAQFIANMSHEIRTPINTIIGMNEMILRENKDEEVESYATNIQNASRLLLGLINDILDFSKIEAGKLDILETKYYLSKMLTDVIKGIQMKAEEKNLIMKAEVEETLPSVLKGDEIRIRQILNNLLSNAVKYTKEGSITLIVKQVEIKDSFGLCISVKDTGMGIREKDIDKLFGSFQRLEEKKNRHIEGTGLGLNITKQLVELMGGSIEVKSEYGKGACFTVNIPQQVIDATGIGKLEDAYQRDMSVKQDKKTGVYAPKAEILVVDDNEMNLAVAKALLKRTGVQLTLAHSGKECLELCRLHKYDIIFMDHMMPELDGIETLHLIRKGQAGLNKDTEIIALTANAIAGMSKMYIKEGFADYLSKPIVAEELEDMMYRHLPAEKREPVEEKPSAALYDIDEKLGLRYCYDDIDMYEEMKKTYCTQGPEQLQKLMEYYESHDWDNYRIVVHAIKSTSMLIGAAAFSEEAKCLEMAAKEANEELLLKESEPFFEHYRRIWKVIGK